jgi:RNA polymerase sigma factor (TIGR02999 family)
MNFKAVLTFFGISAATYSSHTDVAPGGTDDQSLNATSVSSVRRETRVHQPRPSSITCEVCSMPDITTVLGRMQAGDAEAARDLLPLIYDELRRIAAVRMSHEKPGNTLQATALVHEVWLRLVATSSGGGSDNRQQFFAAASESMRRILVDAARRKASLKHGGEYSRIPISDKEPGFSNPAEEVIGVNDALEELERDDAVAAELVKLHYFGGLSLEEAGELLNVSRATAYRIWTFARTFLRASLRE